MQCTQKKMSKRLSTLSGSYISILSSKRKLSWYIFVSLLFIHFASILLFHQQSSIIIRRKRSIFSISLCFQFYFFFVLVEYSVKISAGIMERVTFQWPGFEESFAFIFLGLEVRKQKGGKRTVESYNAAAFVIIFCFPTLERTTLVSRGGS